MRLNAKNRRKQTKTNPRFSFRPSLSAQNIFLPFAAHLQILWSRSLLLRFRSGSKILRRASPDSTGNNEKKQKKECPNAFRRSFFHIFSFYKYFLFSPFDILPHNTGFCQPISRKESLSIIQEPAERNADKSDQFLPTRSCLYQYILYPFAAHRVILSLSFHFRSFSFKIIR